MTEEEKEKWIKETAAALSKAVEEAYNKIFRINRLTDDERVILRNIQNAEMIGRTPNLGQLYVMTSKGETYEIYFNKMFGHLFQFIKNGEEYEIADLLKE